jgi:hypothetical protein
MKNPRPALLSVLLCIPVSLWAQTPSPAPSVQLAITALKGQSKERTQQDITSCQTEAQKVAGAKPEDAARSGQAPATATPPPTTGGAGMGAGGGPAAGAVIGEIADNDAGKGAAIGAGVGAVAGGIRRNKAQQETEARRVAAEQEKANRQQLAAKQIETYNASFKTCLEGRGYWVK